MSLCVNGSDDFETELECINYILTLVIMYKNKI